MDLTLRIAPRVTAWVGIMEDQSGVEPRAEDWISPKAAPPTLLAILKEIGRVYPPLMLANAAAVAAGETQFETLVDGQAWTQQAFPYQAKCLRWLRESRDALPAGARADADAALAGTGCDTMFA